MHGMLHERHRRQEEIKADQAAIERINETIRTNIRPCLVCGVWWWPRCCGHVCLRPGVLHAVSAALHANVYWAGAACAGACMVQDRLAADIEHKTQLKQQVTQQLDGDMQRFRDMEREAAALVSKARHANQKLQVCARLQVRVRPASANDGRLD
jgi:hypothetical protein